MSELDNHRIKEIKTRRLRSRWPRLVGKNARLEEHGFGREFYIREIVTDQGASGWGYCQLPPQQAFKVVGQRVADLIDPASGIKSDELKPLDLALHDLAGVILKQPVYKMLGARGNLQVPVYDGAIYMDDIRPDGSLGGVDIVLENCRRDYALGYRALKLKIGRGSRWMKPDEGLRRDIDVTRAVREHFPKCEILVDGNDGFSGQTFLKYFEAVADCNLYWIEEPFRENRDDLARLRERIAAKSPKTLIADGEAGPNVELLFSLAQEKLIDVLLMDVYSFGFSRWRALMGRVIEHKLMASPHCWDLRLKTHYAAHIGAGLGHVNTVEGVFDETEGVDSSAYEFREGLVRVPDAPGFGMKLIWGRQYNEEGLDASGYKLA